MSRFLSTFGVAKPVIGMVHLGALPGAPLFDAQAGLAGLVDAARADLAALQSAGFDAVMFGNENDRPYEFEVELGEPICDDMRSNLEAMEEFEVEGDHLVRIVAEDMDLGCRRVAYLGFANLPGVTRY